MKNGTGPSRIDHRDLDFHKSYRWGGIGTANIPDTFDADAGLTMPDQENLDTEFSPPVQPMPYGCTNEASNDLHIDQPHRQSKKQ